MCCGGGCRFSFRLPTTTSIPLTLPTQLFIKPACNPTRTYIDSLYILSIRKDIDVLTLY